MDQYLNTNGILCYTDVKGDDLFDVELFQYIPETSDHFKEDFQVVFHSNLGSLTVLNRLTGFGYRDTETGYRAPNGDFWLASGGFDVRGSWAKTIQQAIDWVKSNANTCSPNFK